MQYIIPDYYKEFHCIADKCEETCCSGWQIMIDRRSLKKYKHTKDSYKRELIRGIDFKQSAFRQKDEKRCFFLNERNLCDLYSNLGKDALCRTCRLYPRHIEEFEGVHEITLSVSCPEAARILLSKKEPVSFLTYEKPGEEEYEEFDPFLYSLLLDCREEMYRILRDRSLSIWTRTVLILGMSHDIQIRINQGNMFDCQNVIERYQCPGAVKKASSILFRREMFSFQRKMLRKLHSLEVLNENWPDLLYETEAILYMKGSDFYKECCLRFMDDTVVIQLEQLLVYFISTYFCGAVYDGEVFSKAQLAVICTWQIFDLWLARSIENGNNLSEEEKIELLYRYSREIEHSDTNLKAMDTLMTKYRIPWLH